MRVKQFASILLLTFLCCSFLAVAQAPQKPPVDNDSVYLRGPGTIGTIPVYLLAKKLANSNIKQDGSGNENFGAGINAVGVISGSSDVDASATLTPWAPSLRPAATCTAPPAFSVASLRV